MAAVAEPVLRRGLRQRMHHGVAIDGVRDIEPFMS